VSRIDTIFADLRASGKKALMPFLVAGDPSLHATEGAIISMDAVGADIIEIGIPFSDPIADGPVIAAAMHRSLEAGVTPAHAIGIVSRVRSQVSAGLIAMVSHSIVHRSGGTEFLERLKSAGFDGVIIPDIDEIAAVSLSKYCRSIDISFSMLVAPTTPIERVKKLADLSSGFLYILARLGITGQQGTLPDIEARINEIRLLTDLPLAVGFGISTANQVATVHKWADAAIVGSALVSQMKESEDPVMGAEKFVTNIS